jgi:threonine synthase
MRYISTRGGGSELSFSDVLLEGLAPDGGLYVPKQYPHVSRKQLVNMQNWSYNQIAFQIIRLFVGDAIKGDDLKRIIAKSYTASKFGSLDITPIQPLDHKAGLLKLSNGPTLAFKDVALQLVANLMDHVLTERDEYFNPHSSPLRGASVPAQDTLSYSPWHSIYVSPTTSVFSYSI